MSALRDQPSLLDGAMRDVRGHVVEAASRFGKHPFFARLEPGPDLARAMHFAPSMTFWVMTFQDLIRINAGLARDPVVRALLEHHASEDRGHERWFLDDLDTILGPGKRDIAWLFGPEHARVRELSFALASEAFTIADDRLRLVLILALEAAGRTCFERITSLAQACGRANDLSYLSGHHLNTERAHQLVDLDVEARIDAIALPGGLRLEATALADRVFARFAAMADVLAAARNGDSPGGGP